MTVKERILVVDDEKSVTEELSLRLSDEGYQVKIANGGEEAIEMVKRQAFELVILDIEMPGIDGIVVLDFIKTNRGIGFVRPKVEVIMMTSFSNNHKIIIEAEELGADECLYKPFNVTDLLTTVRQVLDNKK